MKSLIHVQSSNTILYCRRWHETVRFYRDAIGLPVQHATDWFVEFEITANGFLSVADAARTTVASAGGDGITVAWRVGDIDEAHRNLTDAGIAPGPVLSRWGSRVFYFHDPEGHRLELWCGP